MARSDNLFGSYVNRQGESMMDNNYEVLIQGNSFFGGTGHISGIVLDDEGND